MVEIYETLDKREGSFRRRREPGLLCDHCASGRMGVSGSSVSMSSCSSSGGGDDVIEVARAYSSESIKSFEWI
jgi:hypothetical protein